MNEIVSAGTPPAIRGEMDLLKEAEKAALAYTSLWDALDKRNTTAVQRALDDARLIGSTLAPRLAAVRDPASRPEIAVHVAKMLGAMKHLGKVDEAIFVNLLIDDIEDEKPTRIALVTGIRTVRQNCQYLPSIAEVLKAIRDAEEVFKCAATRLERLPERVAEAEAFLIRST